MERNSDFVIVLSSGFGFLITWDGDPRLKFGCTFLCFHLVQRMCSLGRFAFIGDLIGFDYYFFAYFFLTGTFLKVHACHRAVFAGSVFWVLFFWGVLFDVCRCMWLVSYCDLYERNYAWRKTFVHSFFLF